MTDQKHRSLILKVVYLSLLFFTLIVLMVYSYLKADGPLEQPTRIVIPKGISTKQISELLHSRNIIKYPDVFFLITKINYKKKLIAGEYLIEKNVSLTSLINLLHSGKVIIHKLTIPEGTSTYEVVQKINQIDILTGEITQTYGEGLLMPETYYYSYGDKRQDIIDRMHHNLITCLQSLWTNRAPNLPYRNMHEALTMASIIEKETAIKSERNLVSAVFINRLKKNMKLQADPTVVYALTYGKDALERELSKNDLQFDSPYNTYTNLGLPPSPITNPGEASIEAALNPADSNDLYFVADGKGGHNFSSTLSVHNRNVMYYRENK